MCYESPMKFSNVRKYLFLLTAFAALVIGLMLHSFKINHRIAAQYGPLSDAALQIKYEVTLSHLKFEEFISGDTSVRPEDLWEHLDRAQWFVHAMMEGGEGPAGPLIPLKDPVLDTHIQKTMAAVRTFRQMAVDRVRNRDHSGVGSTSEVVFDQNYDQMITLADGISTLVHQGAGRLLKRYRFLQFAMVGLIAVISVILGLIFYFFERRRTRDTREIQAREEYLRITLNSIGDGVIATDLKGNLVRINPIAEGLTGWTVQDAVGRPLEEVFEIVNAHTRNPAFNPVEHVLRTGNIAGLANHTVLISKTGTEYQIADSAAPIRDEHGNIFGVVLVFRDVTRDYLLRDQLEEQQAILQRAQAVARVGHWQMDLDRNPIFASTEACRIYGIDQDTEFSREVIDTIPLPEYRGDIAACIGGLCEASPRAELEFKIQRPRDLQILDIHVIAEYRADNRLISGIVQDITQRKEHETAISQLRQYLTNIIDSMPSLLIGVTPDKRITLWNNETAKETGLLAQEAVGRPLEAAIPRLASMVPLVDEAVAKQKVRYCRRRRRGTEDIPIYENVTIYPLVTNGVEGAVIRVDNVTEQVRMEEIMVQSEKMLSVGGLAAGMAHEINNPLAGILQTSSVMQERLRRIDMPANLRVAKEFNIDLEQIKTFMEQREIFKMLEAISMSGRRVAEIVENMLSFSRKSDGAFSSHYPDQLMDKIISLAEADYDLKKHYDFKRIKVVREYEPDLPMLPCQGGKIQQVLLNILSNAAQAMQENFQKNQGAPPQLVIRLKKESDRFLAIEIQDNGPGVPEAIQKRIFEPFFTTKSVGLGTGLGLSVSYFIITETHGGTLDLISTPGQGACFVIRLPIGLRLS